MAQKLFKVERYEFNFVLADNASQAKDFDFDDSDPSRAVPPSLRGFPSCFYSAETVY